MALYYHNHQIKNANHKLLISTGVTKPYINPFPTSPITEKGDISNLISTSHMNSEEMYPAKKLSKPYAHKFLYGGKQITVSHQIKHNIRKKAEISVHAIVIPIRTKKSNLRNVKAKYYSSR